MLSHQRRLDHVRGLCADIKANVNILEWISTSRIKAKGFYV